MQAFFTSAGLVALAEIGDKTQLLAFILATKFRKPVPIILGILTATLLNHALAGALGKWLANLVNPTVLHWSLVSSFFVMAIWMLIPDRLAEKDATSVSLGVLGTTIITFFLAEIGDKTQILTMALAANYAVFYPVVLGTTCGMMLANIPAVLLGDKLSNKTPLKLVRLAAALICVVLGIVSLFKTPDFL